MISLLSRVSPVLAGYISPTLALILLIPVSRGQRNEVDPREKGLYRLLCDFSYRGSLVRESESKSGCSRCQ